MTNIPANTSVYQKISIGQLNDAYRTGQRDFYFLEIIGKEEYPVVANLDFRDAMFYGCRFDSVTFGMKNEDVYRCHVALSIPTNPQFGSLNLAAAVQLIAYEWRLALGGYAVNDATAAPELADAAQVAGLLAHWERALTDIGFLDPLAPKKLMPRLNQLFNRAGLSPEEIHILRGVAKAMSQAANLKR